METEAGRFVWWELFTPDRAASGRFYSSVLGWETEDVPSPMSPYTLFKASGRNCAGMVTPPPGGPHAGWATYLSHPDVDAGAERVKALGGRVLHPPVDIPDTGRFVTVADPLGNVFALMRPTPPPGVTPRFASHWAELWTPSIDQSFSFYASLFDWKHQDIPMTPAGPYRLFSAGTTELGGMCVPPPERKGKPGWLFYFDVDGLDAALERVQRAGGQVLGGPYDVPDEGRVAQCRDAQGLDFALSQVPVHVSP